MSNGDLTRFDELVSRYLDETLAPEQTVELATLLKEPSFAARFLEITRLSAEIAGLLAAPVPDAAMVELVRNDIEKSPPQPAVTLIRRKGPFWPRLAWAAAFLILVSVAAALLVNRAGRRARPEIVSMQGRVVLFGRDDEHVASGEERWRPGDHLATSEGSGITMKFEDGSQFEIAGDSTAVNESTSKQKRIRLEHGNIHATIQPQPDRYPFIFTTPVAEAVIQGTKLRIATEESATRLEVMAGKVRFRRLSDGNEVTINSGEYALVAPERPMVVQPLEPQ